MKDDKIPSSELRGSKDLHSFRHTETHTHTNSDSNWIYGNFANKVTTPIKVIQVCPQQAQPSDLRLHRGATVLFKCWVLALTWSAHINTRTHKVLSVRYAACDVLMFKWGARDKYRVYPVTRFSGESPICVLVCVCMFERIYWRPFVQKQLSSTCPFLLNHT